MSRFGPAYGRLAHVSDVRAGGRPHPSSRSGAPGAEPANRAPCSAGARGRLAGPTDGSADPPRATRASPRLSRQKRSRTWEVGEKKRGVGWVGLGWFGRLGQSVWLRRRAAGIGDDAMFDGR